MHMFECVVECMYAQIPLGYWVNSWNGKENANSWVESVSGNDEYIEQGRLHSNMVSCKGTV